MQSNYWQTDYYRNEPKYYSNQYPPYQEFQQYTPHYPQRDYGPRYISQSPQTREYIYSKNLNLDREYYHSLQRQTRPHFNKPYYQQHQFQEQQWQRTSYDDKSFQKKNSISNQENNNQQEEFIIKEEPIIQITNANQERQQFKQRQKREFQSRKKRFMEHEKNDQYFTNDQNIDQNLQVNQHRTTPANDLQFKQQFFPNQKQNVIRPQYNSQNEQIKMELTTVLRKLQQAERDKNYLKRELQFKELENGQMKKKIRLYNQDLKDFKKFNDQLMQRSYTLEEKLNEKDYENKDLQNINLEMEIQNTELQKQMEQLKYTLKTHQDFSNKKFKEDFKYNKSQDTISFVTDTLQDTQENLKIYLQNNSVDRFQQKMILQVLDDFLLIIKDIKKNTYLGISKYQKILKQILSNIKTGKLQLTLDLQRILEKFQIDIPRPQTHISLKQFEQQQNGDEYKEIRQELNKNLKKIIVFFEIQKDKDIQISDQIDECNMQYLQMIMDIVMPYNKETSKGKKNKKQNNEKNYLNIQVNNENLTSLDDIPIDQQQIQDQIIEDNDEYDNEKIEELDEEDESYEEDEDFQDRKFHHQVQQSLDQFSINEYEQLKQQQIQMNLNDIYKKDYIKLPDNLKDLNNLEFKVQKVIDFTQKDNDPSTDNYILKGLDNNKILCLFEKEINIQSKPIQFLQIEEIKNVEQKIKGNICQIIIEARENGWCFIFEDKNQAEKCFTYINEFKKYYNNKNSQQIFFKEDIDKISLMKIQSENSRNFWQKSNNFNKDLASFFKDKKLKVIIEKSNQFLLKSRLIAGYIKVFIKTRTDEKMSELKHIITHNGEKPKFDVSLMGEDYKFYMTLLLQKNGIQIDQNFEQDNFEVLKKNVLPKNMDFNILYFYVYKGPGDIEKFKQGYHVQDIEQCRIDNEKDCCLFLQLSDRTFVIEFKSYWFMEMFYYSLIQAQICYYQAIRKSQNYFNYDVEIFYKLLEKKDKKQIRQKIKDLINDLDKMENLDNCNQIFKKVTKNIDLFIEDFYVRIPFDNKLYNFIIYNIHKRIRQKLNLFWNKNFQTIEPLQIIDIIKSINMYFQLQQKYKINDNNFGSWTFDMVYTLISKAIENYKKLITSIIKNMQVDQGLNIKDKKIYSKSCEDINQQLTHIWNNFQYCPNIQTAIVLCESSGKLLQIFLSQILQFLRQNQSLKEDYYIAILNNNYVQIIKNYSRKIYKDCKSFLDKKQIQQIINENILIDLINQIVEISFYKIKKQCMDKFYEIADNDSQFLDYNIEDITLKCFESIQQIEDKIDNNFKISQLKQEFVKDIYLVYIKKSINNAQNVVETNLRQHIEKIQNDQEIMKQITTNISKASQDLSYFITQQLKEFYISEDPNICNICLLNIQVYYPKLISIENIKLILQAKIHFNEEQKQFIIQYSEKSNENNQKFIQKEKNYGKMIYHAYLVHKFALIFIKLYRKKKLKTKNNQYQDIVNIPKIDKEQLAKKYSEPSITAQLCIQSIFDMRGNINFTKYASKYEDDKVIKYLKNKLKKPDSFKKAFIVFHMNYLVFYKNSSMKDIIFSMKYLSLEASKRLQKPKKAKKGEETKIDSKQYVLFFKNQETGVGLYFQQLNPNWIDQFEKAIQIVSQIFSTEQKQIQEIDLTQNVPLLQWKQNSIDYSYSLQKYDITGQNHIEFQDSDDEANEQQILFQFLDFLIFLFFFGQFAFIFGLSSINKISKGNSSGKTTNLIELPRIEQFSNFVGFQPFFII